MSELLSGLNGGNVPALDLIILLTAVALLPSIVIMMTSFLRIVIVLSFTRKCHWRTADSAKCGTYRHLPFSDPVHHGACDQ